MNDADRFRLLHGPYRPPRCRVGRTLCCELRGDVRVTGYSDGPLPWPAGHALGGSGRGKPALILCGDLVKAVLRESNLAVAHHWGVTSQTVTLWRRALDVPVHNEGTKRLWRDLAPDRLSREARALAAERTGSPEARAKKAAAKRGKPRPPHVVEAMVRAHRGKPVPEEVRRKMSASHRRRGTRPPAAGRPWTPEEDALLGKVNDAERVVCFEEFG